MLNYIIWDWNPEIFSIGFIKIRYYGLLFAAGFAIGYYILKKIFIKEGYKLEWLDSLLMYVLVGTVLGARLGHCLFYEPHYYLSHPLEILKVWKGGLASHGGAIGILIALYFYSKKVTHKSMLWTLDRLVIVVALAGCMIRLGNLANSEIYGRTTDSDFGFVHVRDSRFGHIIHEDRIAFYVDDYDFEKIKDDSKEQTANLTLTLSKHIKTEKDAQAFINYKIKPYLRYQKSNDGSLPNFYINETTSFSFSKEKGHFIASAPLVVLPKHPTHIYEASCYFLTFLLLLFIYHKGGLKRSGLIFGIFLLCVFGSRFFIEMIKENQVATEVGKALNNGQKLSIPFVLAGLFITIRALLPQKNKA